MFFWAGTSTTPPTQALPFCKEDRLYRDESNNAFEYSNLDSLINLNLSLYLWNFFDSYKSKQTNVVLKILKQHCDFVYSKYDISETKTLWDERSFSHDMQFRQNNKIFCKRDKARHFGAMHTFNNRVLPNNMPANLLFLSDCS